MTRSRRDTRLLEALAGGATLTAAAETAGISRSTATRRLRDPAFRAALAEIGQAATETTSARLAVVAGLAIDTLTEALADETPAVRVRAAAAILTAVARVPAPEVAPPVDRRDREGMDADIRARVAHLRALRGDRVFPDPKGDDYETDDDGSGLDDLGVL